MSSTMRLGLHVEQRGSLKKHVRALKQRLDRASSDLQASHPPLALFIDGAKAPLPSTMQQEATCSSL